MIFRRKPIGELEHVVGETYRYRGCHFQLYRNGGMWGCLNVVLALTEEDREWNVALGFPEDTPGPVGMRHDAGWLHFRKVATLRAICLDIDGHFEGIEKRDIRRGESEIEEMTR